MSLTSEVGIPTAFFHYQHPHAWDVIVNMCLMQDLVHTDHAVMSVLWSLPYEVQMYIFLPVLFFFVQRTFIQGISFSGIKG